MMAKRKREDQCPAADRVPIVWYARDSERLMSRAIHRTTRAVLGVVLAHPECAGGLLPVLGTFDLMAEQYEREMDVCLNIEMFGRADGHVAVTYRADVDHTIPYVSGRTIYDDMPVWMEPNLPVCRAWLEERGILPADDPRPRTTPNLLFLVLLSLSAQCEAAIKGEHETPTPRSIASCVDDICGRDAGRALRKAWGV